MIQPYSLVHVSPSATASLSLPLCGKLAIAQHILTFQPLLWLGSSSFWHPSGEVIFSTLVSTVITSFLTDSESRVFCLQLTSEARLCA